MRLRMPVSAVFSLAAWRAGSPSKPASCLTRRPEAPLSPPCGPPVWEVLSRAVERTAEFLIRISAVPELGEQEVWQRSDSASPLIPRLTMQGLQRVSFLRYAARHSQVPIPAPAEHASYPQRLRQPAHETPSGTWGSVWPSRCTYRGRASCGHWGKTPLRAWLILCKQHHRTNLQFGRTRAIGQLNCQSPQRFPRFAFPPSRALQTWLVGGSRRNRRPAERLDRSSFRLCGAIPRSVLQVMTVVATFKVLGPGTVSLASESLWMNESFMCRRCSRRQRLRKPRFESQP